MSIAHLQRSTITAGGPQAAPTFGPKAPPIQLSGQDSRLLFSPYVTQPAGSTLVPAGNNSGFSFAAATTYWFAPGIHTISSVISPATGSTFVGAPGAVLDGQNIASNNAFGGNNPNVTIRYLTIQNFPSDISEFVVNHAGSERWTVEFCTVQNCSQAAGVGIGNNCIIRYCLLTQNGQYGFSSFRTAGCSNVLIDHCEVSYNDLLHLGGGQSGGCKFWNTAGGTITNCWIHHSESVGLWMDTDNCDFVVTNNYFSDNKEEALFYEVSYNLAVRHNTFVRNTWVKGLILTGFADGAIYISESGGDSRALHTRVGATTEICFNTFVDNWNDVILWENADRFSESPTNPSTSYLTYLGQYPVEETANATWISASPYIDDSRWKTQNVQVHNNDFHHHPANVPSSNTISGGVGIFSQFGTFPAWSPYKGTLVENRIVNPATPPTGQQNLFSNNTYNGPYRFFYQSQTNGVNLATWQGAGQDVTGSKVLP